MQPTIFDSLEGKFEKEVTNGVLCKYPYIILVFLFSDWPMVFKNNADNRDLSQLSSLDSQHPGFSKIWALVPTPSTGEELKPEANEKGKGMQERGAKFRAFISDGRPLPLDLKVASQIDGPAVGGNDSFEVGSDKRVRMLGNRVGGRGSGDGGILGREFLYARM